MALITLKNVTIAFEGVPAVENVSYTVERGDYMVIIGEKEAEAGTVSVRSRHDGDLGTMPVADFITLIKEVIDTKAKK